MKKQIATLTSILFICGSVYAATGGIGALFGALIGGAAGHAIGKSSFQKLTIDEGIVKMAGELNKSLPMAVDRDTRLDSVSPGLHGFTYHYTFVNSRSEEFDRPYWYREVAPPLRKRVCANEDLAVFFKNGISIAYSYKGKDGGQVGKVTISPADCGYKS